MVSNSEGARRAAAEADAATLGSETAADLYGLAVVEARVEDESSNTTRFLVLGQTDAPPSGRDKTSLVMGAKNQPGAVVKLLQPLADSGISMSKLESRTARSSKWEYLFFVVCEAIGRMPGWPLRSPKSARARPSSKFSAPIPLHRDQLL